MTDGPFDIAPERAFIKHKVFGEVYAIEHAMVGGARSTLAARKCTRPEEMTSGALPVLTLHSSGDALEFVTKNYLDFALWEAPKVREELVEAATAAMKERDELAASYNKLRKDERAALKRVEAADEKVRVTVRALNAPPTDAPPLLSIAEGSNTAPIDAAQVAGDLSPEEFDAALGEPFAPPLDVPDPQSPEFYDIPDDDAAPSAGTI